MCDYRRPPTTALFLTTLPLVGAVSRARLIARRASGRSKVRVAFVCFCLRQLRTERRQDGEGRGSSVRGPAARSSAAPHSQLSEVLASPRRSRRLRVDGEFLGSDWVKAAPKKRREIVHRGELLRAAGPRQFNGERWVRKYQEDGGLSRDFLLLSSSRFSRIWEHLEKDEELTLKLFL
eukprot:766618-Hanusia_phi.AAC.11